jgi:RNase P subunit RPR2
LDGDVEANPGPDEYLCDKCFAVHKMGFICTALRVEINPDANDFYCAGCCLLRAKDASIRMKWSGVTSTHL